MNAPHTEPAESILGAPGERFEWIDTDERRSTKPVEAGGEAHAQLARRCRQCGWLDSITELECFRCGEAFPPPEDIGVKKAQAASLPPGAVEVKVRPARELLGPGKNTDFDVYRLRRRSAELSHMPDFDTLLALGQVNQATFQSYDHQEQVAKKVLQEMNGATLLADETGLGKTIEAGLVLKELMVRGLVRTVLVVLPASLGLQWKEEMSDKFGLDFVVAREFKDVKDDPPLVICSYAAMRGRSVGDKLRKRDVDLLICDEAHHLKNRSTKQYRAVSKVPKKFCLLLSATPFHNKLIELKNLLDILKPGLLGSTRAFNKQYVDEKDPRKPRNVHHLQKLLGEVMIRNRRSEVSVRLPPRRAATYHIELHPEEREFYDELSTFISGEVRMRAESLRGPGARQMSFVLALINLQRELCSSPPAVAKALERLAVNDSIPLDVGERLSAMAKKVVAYQHWRKAQAVDEILEQFPGKIVIFSEFLATIAALIERLRGNGIVALPFHGGMNAHEKAAAIEAFRGDTRVLVASRAGAEGLNLQFCSTVLNFDLPWNPMQLEQRIGRVHRLGQKDAVTVLNLSVQGTIEARILELLTQKLQLFTTVLGEVDLILGALHAERGFDELLREAWLAGTIDDDLENSLEQFGEDLARARSEYESIKNNEAILDSLAPRNEQPTTEGA